MQYSESGADGEQEDDEEGNSDMTMMNAAWRAMKEAGDLLATLLSVPTTVDVAIWTSNEVAHHGSLFGTWLLEVEHRGAFAHIVSHCSVE